MAGGDKDGGRDTRIRASLSYVSLFLIFFFPTFLFPHVSRCLTSLFLSALFPIKPAPPPRASPSNVLSLLSTPFLLPFPAHLHCLLPLPFAYPPVLFGAPPSYRIPSSHYVSCMCLCVIRHKAEAKQPNEQTPALCSGPGDPPELLMYNSSEERREKRNSLTRRQITAQRKSCINQRSPGRRSGAACSEYFTRICSMFCRPKIF